MGLHPGFTNGKCVPPTIQEAKKAPDLERYVGGYIYISPGFPACEHYQAFFHKQWPSMHKQIPPSVMIIPTAVILAKIQYLTGL